MEPYKAPHGLIAVSIMEEIYYSSQDVKFMMILMYSFIHRYAKKLGGWFSTYVRALVIVASVLTS
jgi:hypothetical protein